MVYLGSSLLLRRCARTTHPHALRAPLCARRRGKCSATGPTCMVSCTPPNPSDTSPLATPLRTFLTPRSRGDNPGPMATSSQLSHLPVAVHGQAVSRLSQSELLQFEGMLATADDTLEACMIARSVCRLPASDDTATGVLQAVIDAVCALTNAPPPTSLQSKHSAVVWINSALLEMRNRAVDKAVTNNFTHGMDPQSITTCMELVSKLNSVIGGAPRPDYA